MKSLKEIFIGDEEPAKFLDAMIAAPQHHKILFEDERVRVIELKVKPGEIVPVHTHRWASLNYVINHSDFLSCDVEGNVKVDSRTAEADIKQGAIFYLPPYPPLHSVENIGSQELHGITVELKNQ